MHSASAPVTENAPVARRGTGDPAMSKIIALVCREHGISKTLMMQRSRGTAASARARQVAMYLARVVLGMRMADVGEAFHRDRTTVSYACVLVEDLRDNPAFDRELDRLEALILAQCA
jgi:chromosomal replication initiation ATPase DnaA